MPKNASRVKLNVVMTANQFLPANMEERKKLDFRAGDTVRVWVKIAEKGKTRNQAFEGLVLARKHGTEIGATYTVRNVAEGVGVERIFPLYSPSIDKIEIIKRTKARRSKLYYIRDKAAREVTRKMRSLRTTSVVSRKPTGEMASETVSALSEEPATV